jgi:glucose-1-phosphate cytidylyltransferase
MEADGRGMRDVAAGDMSAGATWRRATSSESTSSKSESAMKVVLFCGGMGMRLRDYSDAIPKPLVPIGPRPILWHLMKYYAHYGHRDFILCLGWQGQAIKEFFLKYDECSSNDFTLAPGGQVRLLGSDIQDWHITFVDTGQTSSIGQRLRAVEPYLRGEPWFLANYADGLTDLPLPELIETAQRRDSVATFLGVRPSQSFHLVESGPDRLVNHIEPIDQSNLRMNGGFFVLKHEIFEYLQPGEDLVAQPFMRLIQDRLLSVHHHDGFWACMDTFKEKQNLDELYARGEGPWEVWKRAAPALGVRREGDGPKPTTGIVARRFA